MKKTMTVRERARAVMKYLQLCAHSAKAARSGFILRAKTIGMQARKLHRAIWS